MVSTTDTNALPEHQLASRSSPCQRTSHHPTLKGTQQPQRLSKDLASRAVFPSTRPSLAALRRWVRPEMPLLTGTAPSSGICALSGEGQNWDARRRSSRRASSLCLLVLSRLAELTLLLLNPLLSKLGSASDPAAAAIGLRGV